MWRAHPQAVRVRAHGAARSSPQGAAPGRVRTRNASQGASVAWSRTLPPRPQSTATQQAPTTRTGLKLCRRGAGRESQRRRATSSASSSTSAARSISAESLVLPANLRPMRCQLLGPHAPLPQLAHQTRLSPARPNPRQLVVHHHHRSWSTRSLFIKQRHSEQLTAPLRLSSSSLRCPLAASRFPALVALATAVAHHVRNDGQHQGLAANTG